MYKVNPASLAKAISNTRQPKNPTEQRFRSWMIKYGLRRYLASQSKLACEDCGTPRNAFYRLHPFPMPQGFGKGLWMFTDCQCIRKRRSVERNQIHQFANAKTEPLTPALRNYTFSNFKVGDYNKQAYQVCQQFVKNFAKI